jgi:ABC-type nickel/cobalt efflux system permease component RcnA
MKKLIVRLGLALSVTGSALLASEVAHRLMVEYSYSYSSDTLVAYGRWETLSWVLAGLGLILTIWAFVSTRND